MPYLGSILSDTAGEAGDQAQVLTLDGEFDLSNSTKVEKAIDNAQDSGSPDLVVDLRGVSFIDSTTMRALAHGFKQAQARDTKFALIHPNPLVWRIFVLTGLSDTLPAFGGLPAALASFGPRS